MDDLPIIESEMDEVSHQTRLRKLISTYTESYDFFEVYDVKDSSNDSEEIQIKTVKKGVFQNNENHLGIICKFVNIQFLKAAIQTTLRNRIKIDNVYEGEKYLLCYANSEICSFKIEYYNQLNSIIDGLGFDYFIEYRNLRIGIGEDISDRVLIIETNLADFLIAGQIKDDQEEVERVILSNKLEASQPFFKFKAPIYFDWDKLLGDKDRQFERICELLLQKESNITSIIPIGKTRAADRGRDFEVVEKIHDMNSSSEIKWLVQCKFSEKSISPSSISGWTDRIIEHKYDGFWLMTNNDVTPSLFDQFNDVSSNDSYLIKTKFWQRSDFHIKLNVHSELFTNNDIFKIG